MRSGKGRRAELIFTAEESSGKPILRSTRGDPKSLFVVTLESTLE